MNKIIEQLKCVKEHLKWIKTEYIPVDFDIEVLDGCIAQLEDINKKPSEDEIIKKLEILFLIKEKLNKRHPVPERQAD